MAGGKHEKMDGPDLMGDWLIRRLSMCGVEYPGKHYVEAVLKQTTMNNKNNNT